MACNPCAAQAAHQDPIDQNHIFKVKRSNRRHDNAPHYACPEKAG